MRNRAPFLLTLLLGLVFSFFAITPPKTQGSETSPLQFSSARAMIDVREISRAPHPTGSEDNARVRAYLSERLTELGLDVSTSEGELDEKALRRFNKWSGQSVTSQAIVNVIGILPGADRSKPALLLMAHHDTVWGSPGAADDTVGIAAILEILRAVRGGGGSPRDVIVLLTDGEELGLNGAELFFSQNPLRERTGAIINFEARGGGGTANMFQTSAENGEAAKLYARAVKQPSVSSLSTFIYSILPNDTDLTPALAGDYTAYNIANIGRAEFYHSPKITADALDERSLQHMGSQGLDLTRALITADEFPAKSPDAAFFDFFGFFTIIFAPFWGWVFLGLAAVCFALSMKAQDRVKDVSGGALRMLAFIVGGGGLLYGLNVVSGGGRAANYYDRLAAISELELMAAALCIALFFAVFGRKALSENGLVGAALPLFVLAIIGQAYAPTAAYVLTLPMLICGIVFVARARWPDAVAGAGLSVACCAVLFGFIIGLGHLLMLGVGPDMPSAAILLAALGVLALLPLYPALSKRVSYRLAGAAFAVSVAAALWIRLDPIAATVPLY